MSNWTVDDVRSAIIGGAMIHQADDEIRVLLFDESKTTGVGTDATGQVTFLFLGHAHVPVFHENAVSFDADISAFWVEGDRRVSNLAALRFRVDREDLATVDLVACIIVGLLDLLGTLGDIGPAISALRRIYGHSLGRRPDRQTQIGLAGELIVMLASSEPQSLLDYWHSNADARYDFSNLSRRLEVKTTTSNLRTHNFSSTQLPSPPGMSVLIVSVQIAEVEHGCSVGELADILDSRISATARHKLKQVVLETTGLPSQALQTLKFDLASSIASVRVCDAIAVPTPRAVDGVLQMSWSANLPESQFVEVDYLRFLEAADPAS